MKAKKERHTRSRRLDNPKRFQQTQKRLNAIRLATHLYDDTIVAYIDDFGAELGREDGDGMEVLVF